MPIDAMRDNAADVLKERCPFCHLRAGALVGLPADDRVFVRCLRCGATGPLCPSAGAARRNWSESGDHWSTCAEAASLHRVAAEAIKYLARSGQVRARRSGGVWLVELRSIGVYYATRAEIARVEGVQNAEAI